MSQNAFEFSAESWLQVQDILAEAVERDPDERVAFLTDACGEDDELFREVHSLLQALDEADNFLDELDASGAVTLLAEGENIEAGRLVGPYRIERALGRGGMGVVYLAEDTRLERRVALKFLPPHLAADEAATQRLITEAKASAALDHPNIAIVHEIGETDDGRRFIAMAYYDGDTLRARISRGPIPVPEALDLARQIVDGLQAAHRRGIVHRDIKPSNILITRDGVAKIVDFGIAVLLGTEPTTSSATLGTIAYMSPEQTRGDPVNARTDLWSVGIVLYEMLTGHRPFRGDNDRSLINAIQTAVPESLHEVGPEIPTPLAEVVQRCLEKDPEARYPDAASLQSDLDRIVLEEARTWRERLPSWRLTTVVGFLVLSAFYLAWSRSGGEVATKSGHRIAVLSLDNVSQDAGDAYFAAGMTDELVSRLSKISGLRVIGRTSVMRYSGTDRSVAEIGSDLDVEAVLEGSVRKSGDDVRITVQFVDVESEENIWAAAYDANVSDVLDVQSEIAGQIADALRIQLRAADRHLLDQPGTDSQDAYQLFLKGRYELGNWDEESVTRAREHFEQAVELDPAFAQAWAGLADAYKLLDYLAVLDPATASPRSRSAAERALELDPDLAEAHAALAATLVDYYYDWESAGEHYRQAVELDPSSAVTRASYAEYLRDRGDFDKALAAIEEAQTLDPLSPYFQMIEGIVLLFARRYEPATEHFEQLLAVYPEYGPAYLFTGLTYLETGRYEDALDAANKVDPTRSFPDALGLRAGAFVRLGRSAEARAILDELETISAERYVSPFIEAFIRGELGERDRAFELLELGYEERTWFMRILKVAPQLDSFRSDPRFDLLLEKIGLSE